MAEMPYLARGVMPVETPSSVLVSSSKYLNNPRLRDWLSMILLRRNGPDLPPPAEMYEFLPILEELRDHDAIEAMFTEERRINPELDAWFDEGFCSTYAIEDFAQYAPGTLGGIFYRWITEGNYEIQIVPWREPASQLEFYNLRSGQTHDFEHILCGGGFNFMGELVPYWYRLTNVFKFIRNPELAAELLKEAQDDVERQWRVYSARAGMPGRGETPHIAPAEKPDEKLAAPPAGGSK